MKFSLSGGIAILLIVYAVLSAGCTDSARPVPSVTTPQVTATILPVTGTTAAITVLQTSANVPITATKYPVRIFGTYNWAEYRNNMTVTMPPNPRYQWESVVRTERSPCTYNGIPAIHEKSTETGDYPEWVGGNLIHTKNGWIIVIERYFDASTDKVLGGTMAEIIKGVAQPPVDIPADGDQSREDRPSGHMGITPFGEMNISLMYEGTESVKVPAGTYPDARKYTGKFRDGTPITFWVVSGIPVPVQYQFPNRYMDGVDPFQSYELKGWE